MKFGILVLLCNVNIIVNALLTSNVPKQDVSQLQLNVDLVAAAEEQAYKADRVATFQKAIEEYETAIMLLQKAINSIDDKVHTNFDTYKFQFLAQKKSIIQICWNICLA